MAISEALAKLLADRGSRSGKVSPSCIFKGNVLDLFDQLEYVQSGILAIWFSLPQGTGCHSTEGML